MARPVGSKNKNTIERWKKLEEDQAKKKGGTRGCRHWG